MRGRARVVTLQWRAGQLPGRTSWLLFPNASRSITLQWRAGQLPGRTGPAPMVRRHRQRRFNGGPGNCPAEPQPAGRGCVPPSRASMEGRAIARPNVIVHVDGTRSGGWASMEGRAIARPNLVGLSGRVVVLHASMEGRAIARPNQGHRSGDGHCENAASMEGRAIARPNVVAPTSEGRAEGASMEGRAIARPNDRPRGRYAVRRLGFNGGPGNCPAERPRAHRHPGALPDRASMEGRAIARPNVSWLPIVVVAMLALQWRAGQLPGRTGGCCATPGRR